MNNVLLRYFTNNGREVIRNVTSVEEAILVGRAARRSFAGANFRKYSVDSGATWHYI